MFFEILLFLCIVGLSLYMDLKAHSADKHITIANAAMWSGIWVSVALMFCGYIGIAHDWNDASLFLTGYVLEKSLSVDNLFVIMAIFSAFTIKDELQHRVLYYGILGAIVLRFVFVAAGSALVAVGGKFALGFFGLFVLWSAFKMWKEMGNEEQEIEDYQHHFSVRWTEKFFPIWTKLSGHDFFVIKDGVRFVTPLFLCLICVEFADVMFAFDSVPAVIAVTQKPFLVYTSNIFAILGLRSLYFLLIAAKKYLCHLEKSVIVVLAFIGFKMIADVLGLMHIDPIASLIVVLTVLTLGMVASFMFPEKETVEA